MFKLHKPLRHKPYNALRRYLRVRQNPPAYTTMARAISFPCHCPSVVGFSSPHGFSRCMSPIKSGVLSALDGGCAQGAFERAGLANSSGLLTCAQPPPFF
jgi:hypothetical protein